MRQNKILTHLVKIRFVACLAILIYNFSLSGCGGVEVLLQDLTNIGTFSPAKNYDFLGTSPRSVAIGDINADTLNDLIVSDWTTGVAVRHQDPSAAGTFLQGETVYNPN